MNARSARDPGLFALCLIVLLLLTGGAPAANSPLWLAAALNTLLVAWLFWRQYQLTAGVSTLARSSGQAGL